MIATLIPNLYNKVNLQGCVMNYCFESLNEKLSYDKATGELTWNERSGTRGSATFNKRFAGSVVGHKDRGGYLGVSIGGAWYLAHRVAWVLHHGEIDNGMYIDHINHNRSDNRIENLRLVSRGKNSRNRSPNKNTKFCVGVTYRSDRGKFESKITRNKVVSNLGNFSSLLEAVCARKSAENKMGFHSNHGR